MVKMVVKLAVKLVEKPKEEVAGDNIGTLRRVDEVLAGSDNKQMRSKGSDERNGEINLQQ
jgi:hypothetical protein